DRQSEKHHHPKTSTDHHPPPHARSQAQDDSTSPDASHAAQRHDRNAPQKQDRSSPTKTTSNKARSNSHANTAPEPQSTAESQIAQLRHEALKSPSRDCAGAAMIHH